MFDSDINIPDKKDKMNRKIRESVKTENRSRFPRRLVRTLCVFLFMVFCMTVSVFAEEEPETVRVGYYPNEIFQEGAADGEVKNGYAYEYYRKISEYTGWKYEYVYGEFGELYQKLLDGEVDLLAGLAWREERADLIGYPDAIMGNESYYLVRLDTKTEITADPATLNGRKIGVLDSAVAGVLDKYLEEHHIDDGQPAQGIEEGAAGAHTGGIGHAISSFVMIPYYYTGNLRRCQCG